MKVELIAPEGCVGDRQVRTDVIDARALVQLAALLDRNEPAPAPGDALPAGRHWLYFTPAVPQSQLKPDGIALRSPPMPEVANARRMWAGGRTDFLRPLTVGSQVRRETEVKSVYKKSGKSGDLVFVVLRHEISDAQGVAIVEEQDMLYRDPANIRRSLTAPRQSAPGDAQWQTSFTADLSMLFRFSAITFNAHRIHFDPQYAREADGYEGALVHGPLLALMLMDQCAAQLKRPIKRLAYRGVSPLFHGTPAVLAGRAESDHIRAWAATADGKLALSAEITLG